MPRYAALLRAINVGGHVLKMERLRALFVDLGFSRVETFIASGNVIFDCDESDACLLEERIERHMKDALGYPVATYLRTLEEISAVAVHRPFDLPDALQPGCGLYVLFLKLPPSEEVSNKLLALRTDTDEFEAHGREVYWLCRGNAGQSRAGALMGKALGAPGTMRNINTIRRLAARYGGPEPQK